MRLNRFLALSWYKVQVTACCLLVCLSATALAVATEPDSSTVRVATWNLGALSSADQEKASRALALFADTVDVIALQECPDPGQPLTTQDGSKWQGIYEYSNAILSRWPIVQSGLVAANPAWARDLPWADIQPPAGPAFRIYSIHLTFKRHGNPFLGAARAVEIRRILIHARGFVGPVILAGDFNTVGWILGGQESEPAIELLQASGYVDALGSVGGRTQAVLGRLDWIYTRGFAAADQVLGNYDGSDHRWLQASLSASDAAASDAAPMSESNTVTLLAATALGLLGVAVWRKRKRRVEISSP
ncbi:MAG: endonuclease/exonuclease/phosphatase family protein [Acidobacteria bacterium]|nr:endonuclease/exonuclease/phosphatase family protein [Acidobacteriota bacterium]MDA1236024.1 endonuclease/exonuclease/phosphatase family protein [Acidobacteriota bacterium]